MTFTMAMLDEAVRKMREIAPERLPPAHIIVSAHCLKETTERLFPASKNRSKRIHKKLVKRFGGEFRKAPAMFQTPQGILCHPALYASLKHTLEPTR